MEVFEFAEAPVLEETLDPDNWAQMEALCHGIFSDAIAHLRNVRERPVWQEMPPQVRASFETPLPRSPAALGDILSELRSNLFPYSMGNIHPRFWAWYMGSGNLTGAIAEFLAAVDGSNLGGGSNAATALDRQVTQWISQIMEFPEGSSAALVGGGSMANIIGLMAARNAMAGVDLHSEGLSAMDRPLRFYASDQVHNCHQKAMNLFGLGGKALRKIATGDDFTMDLEALRAAIAQDRADGIRPACVIATAGTTNTGAIDDLMAIADLCANEGIWLHIDGCIGALIKMAPRNRHLVAGLERADSLALDLHKWLHAPFGVGCALLRDRKLHRSTFCESAEYLQVTPRGMAAEEFLHDYTLETTRSFEALKVWMMLKHHGVEKFGRLIDQNIDQAHYLADMIGREPRLELLAPVTIDIVCFRYNPGLDDEQALRALNTEIMLRLQESGIAAPSDTTLRGRHCLRVGICNHRTRREDLELLVDEVLRIGGELLGEATQPVGTTK